MRFFTKFLMVSPLLFVEPACGTVEEIGRLAQGEQYKLLQDALDQYARSHAPSFIAADRLPQAVIDILPDDIQAASYRARFYDYVPGIDTCITIGDDVFCPVGQGKITRDIILHEMTHSAQYAREGNADFLKNILRDYASVGHDNSPLEREAVGIEIYGCFFAAVRRDLGWFHISCKESACWSMDQLMYPDIISFPRMDPDIISFPRMDLDSRIVDIYRDGYQPGFWRSWMNDEAARAKYINKTKCGEGDDL